MTPCNPSNPLRSCASCARFSPALPHEAECRRVVCIDASKLLKHGRCQLVEWRKA